MVELQEFMSLHVFPAVWCAKAIPTGFDGSGGIGLDGGLAPHCDLQTISTEPQLPEDTSEETIIITCLVGWDPINGWSDTLGSKVMAYSEGSSPEPTC